MNCKLNCPHIHEEQGGFLFRELSVLHRYGKLYMGSLLKDKGLGNCHPPYLIAVSLHPGMSQEQLSGFLKIDKGAVAKAVCHMIEDGYIYKEQNTEDKRCYNLFLTEKGEKIIPEMQKMEMSFEKVLTQGMSSKEQKMLSELLHKSVINLLAERGISINETFA